MQIEYSKASLKFLRSADKRFRDKIISAINELIEIPPKGDFKPLQGTKNQYRLRIGKYRILYSIDGDTLKVDEIGSRGDIYK